MRATHVLTLIAVVLILAILTMRIGSVSHFSFVKPIQNYISKASSLQEDNIRQKVTFFKIKRSLQDVAPDSSSSGLPPYLPFVSRLVPKPSFQALPEVYLDILLPPDEII